MLKVMHFGAGKPGKRWKGCSDKTPRLVDSVLLSETREMEVL